MQFLLGILVMRTSVGFDMFNWLGIQIQVNYWAKMLCFISFSVLIPLHKSQVQESICPPTFFPLEKNWVLRKVTDY